MKIVTCLSVLFVFWLATPLLAQEKSSSKSNLPQRIDENVTKLDTASRRMVSYLQSLEDYQVDVSLTWKLEGIHQRSGGNELRLEAHHDGRFHLHVHPQGAEEDSLVCVGDGQKVTRMMDRDGKLIYSRSPGNLSQLLDDVMTETSVRHSGLDLLLRDDPERFLMSMSSEIQYLGDEQLPGGTAQHFQMKWGTDRAQIHDLWISSGQSPVLVKQICTLQFAVAEADRQTMTITSNLTWKPNADLDEHFARPQVPESAQEVTDLYGYLAEGGTIDLVGKEAPLVELPMLGGDSWDLALHRDKEVVVLYFYATWAAPCREQIPELMEFVRSFEKRDVAFYPIDVGEEVAIAEAFVKSQKYDHPVVLDSESRAAAAYRVTSLPLVVVIDKKGMIASANVGNTQEVRAMVREDLERLLRHSKAE